MKLSYYCDSCKKENHIKTNAPDRYSFLVEYGNNEINEKCSHCGNNIKKHINRLKAETNNYIIIVSILFAIIITIVFWNFGFLSTLSGTIPIWTWMYLDKKTNIFNRTRVK